MVLDVNGSGRRWFWGEMVQGVDASGAAMIQGGSGCQWFSNSVCQWFRVSMVLRGEGSKVAMVMGG